MPPVRKPKHAEEHSMFSNLFYFLRLLFAASPALVIGELAWGVLTVLPASWSACWGLSM